MRKNLSYDRNNKTKFHIGNAFKDNPLKVSSMVTLCFIFVIEKQALKI